MKRLWLALVALLGCACAKAPTLTQGVPNLHPVGPNVWRSAQPIGVDQWKAVAALGVRSVVKLNFEDEGSDAIATDLGMTVYEFGMEPAGDKDVFDNVLNTFKRPDRQAVLDAVSLLSLTGGVLVHCTHGQDRTGLVVGLYRTIHDGWTKTDAYHEMLQLGFHPELRGLREFWEDFVAPPLWDH